MVGQSVGLPAQLLQIAVVADHPGSLGDIEFLLLLGGHPGLRLLFRQLIPFHDPPETALTGRHYRHGYIADIVHAALKQQRGIQHRHRLPDLLQLH